MKFWFRSWLYLYLLSYWGRQETYFVYSVYSFYLRLWTFKHRGQVFFNFGREFGEIAVFCEESAHQPLELKIADRCIIDI